MSEDQPAKNPIENLPISVDEIAEPREADAKPDADDEFKIRKHLVGIVVVVLGALAVAWFVNWFGPSRHPELEVRVSEGLGRMPPPFHNAANVSFYYANNRFLRDVLERHAEQLTKHADLLDANIRALKIEEVPAEQRSPLQSEIIAARDFARNVAGSSSNAASVLPALQDKGVAAPEWMNAPAPIAPMNYCELVITNKGKMTAKNVEVVIPWGSLATIQPLGREPTVVDHQARLPLGDLRKGDPVRVTIWTMTRMNPQDLSAEMLICDDGECSVKMIRAEFSGIGPWPLWQSLLALVGVVAAGALVAAGLMAIVRRTLARRKPRTKTTGKAAHPTAPRPTAK